MSRFIRTATIGCLALLFCVTTLFAQDYDAIWKRLKKSAKKGEISMQQAETMMAALKKTNAEKKVSEKDVHLQQIELKLKAAVENGAITHEQALEKWQAITGEAAQTGSEKAKHLEAIGNGLKSAIALGLMSEEEAKRVYMEAKQGRGESFQEEEVEIEIAESYEEEHEAHDRFRELENHLRDIHHRLDASERRWDELMHRLEQHPPVPDEGDWGDELHEAREQLKRAVEEGDITVEQAEREFAEIAEQFERREKEAGRFNEELEKRAQRIREELERAVEQGELTEEEAHDKWEAVERELRERAGQR